MAAGNTYTPLATQTLGSAAASVTFSSISGAYTDLVLVITCTSVSGVFDAYIQFNLDTGNNYSATVLYGTGSAAGSYRQSTVGGILQDFEATVSSEQSNRITQVMNYSNTTTYKTAINRANRAGGGVDATVGLWRNTAAITSLTINAQGAGSFATGSTFTLYGIAAA